MERPGLRPLLLACACAVAVLAWSPGVALATNAYVALGDSFTAGPMVPYPKGEPSSCRRSDHNYPSLVAAEIRAGAFRDVSCASAQTEDMTGWQTGLAGILGAANPPQFGALDPAVDLVTVGIGANDMGFRSVVATCVRLGIQSLGIGRPCTDHYTSGGVDHVAQRIDATVGPRLATVLAGIQERSPSARLLVVGDPNPMPAPPGCFPLVPFARGDLPFLHGLARRLHEMRQARAAEAGAEYVDQFTGSAGHDVCRPPGAKWYEGFVPTDLAFPAHPNRMGMRFAARQVLEVLRRPVPNDFGVRQVRGGRSGAIAAALAAPHRGTFTITAVGRGLRYPTVAAFAPRPGDVLADLRLEPAGQAALRRRGRARVALTITFAPVGGEPATRRAQVRVGARRRGV